MPWEIKQNYGGCSGYAVVKEGTTDVEGCHASREAAQKQVAALYASENSTKSEDPLVQKYRGELYDQLTTEEKAFHDALLSVAAQHGPFDLGTSSIWVGYEPAEENEDAGIGVKCANCSFFNPSNNGCAILSYTVEAGGKCRLAAIPDGYVMPEMDDEEESEFVQEMLYDMDKAQNVRVGQMVSWNSSGGTARGKVKRIVRRGKYNVPNSDFTISGTPENPAVVIEVYRDDKPTGTVVGHRMQTLRTEKMIVEVEMKKMYTVVENHPGCSGGWAVVESDGKMEACFATKELADAYAAKENMEEMYDDKIEELEQEKEMMEEQMESKKEKMWSVFDPRTSVTKSEDVSLFTEKRDYGSEARRRMAASGQAMDDGSFPIANTADLRNAIQSVGRASNYEAARRHIIRRARALGATDMLPEDWPGSTKGNKSWSLSLNPKTSVKKRF